MSVEQHGERWTAQLLLVERRAQCMAVDPHEPQTLFLGTRGGGLSASRDGGRRWKPTNMPAKDVFSVAVSPVDGAVYAGCEPSAIYKSADGGVSWSELESLRRLPSSSEWSYPPRPWTSHVRWIAPHPHDAGRLLAGIELGGLMYSEDGGETWEDHRPNAQRDVHGIAWHPSNRNRAYEAGGGGPAWSRDGGRSWERLDRGLDRRYTWALALHPQDPDTWFISASPGPGRAHSDGNAQAGIYRWRSDGPWTLLRRGLPNPLDSMPYTLLSGDGYVLAGLHDGRMFISHDEGDSWRPVEIEHDALQELKALVPAS